MRGLFKFSEARGVKKIEDITEDVMRDYFEVIRTKYAVPTICGRWLEFSVFFGWLQKSGYILSNPLDSVRKPKKNRRVIYSFNHSEINEIMTFYDKSTFIGFRNYTIMAVFWGTGIRKAELLGLQPESIDFDTKSLFVIGKGSKERFVPFGAKLETVLRRYLKMRNMYLLEQSNSCSSLFITKDGGSLSESGVNTIFSTLKKSKKRWSPRVSPHTFRHTYAKLFLLNGGDLFSLQKMIRQQKRMQMEEAYRKQAEEIRSAKERAEIEKRLREEEERLKKIPVTPEEIQAMLSDIGNAIISQSRSNDRRIALYNTIYTDKNVRTQIALSVATKGKSKKFRKHLMKIQAAQKEVKRLKQTGGDKSRIANLEGQIKKATDQAKDMHEYLNYHTNKNLAKKIYDRINMMQPKRRAKAMEIQNQNEEYEKLNAKVIYIMMQLKKNKNYTVSREDMKALKQLADMMHPARRKELKLGPQSFDILKNRTEKLLGNLQAKIESGNKVKQVSKQSQYQHNQR